MAVKKQQMISDTFMMRRNCRMEERKSEIQQTQKQNNEVIGYDSMEERNFIEENSNTLPMLCNDSGFIITVM